MSLTGLEPYFEKARQLSLSFSKTAAFYDESAAFPHDNFTRLYEAGLLGLTMAKEEGGAGAGLLASVELVNIIAKGDPSTALVLAMHLSHHYAIRASDKWPRALAAQITKANRERVALINSLQVEPVGGSPSHGGLPATTAKQEGDHWRINGHKTYATGIPALEFLNVFALTNEQPPRLGSFLVPKATQGVRVVETWDATGMRATRSDDVLFEDVLIPIENVIEMTPSQGGIKRDAREGAWYFGLIPAVYDGAAQAARDWVIAFATSRRPGSLGASLSTLPRFEEGLGEIEVLLATNRRLLRSLAADYDAGVSFGADAGVVKHNVIENAQRVSAIALDLGGNPALSRSHPLERHHRNILGARAHAPQNNMIRAQLGRNAFAAFAATQDRTLAAE